MLGGSSPRRACHRCSWKNLLRSPLQSSASMLHCTVGGLLVCARSVQQSNAVQTAAPPSSHYLPAFLPLCPRGSLRPDSAVRPLGYRSSTSAFQCRRWPPSDHCTPSPRQRFWLAQSSTHGDGVANPLAITTILEKRRRV